MTSRAPLHLVAIADDPRTARTLRVALGPADTIDVFSFDGANDETNGELSSRLEAAADRADAILIEWDPLRAPEIGAACLRLRAPQTLIAALGDATLGDHVAALAVGADRFLPLPLPTSLLRAQIVAHRRHGLSAEDRRRSDRPAWARDRRLSLGPLDLDWGERAARVGGAPLSLTPRQFEVLALFAARHREVLSRERVLEDVWGFQFETGTNVVDVYVHHLRRLLAARGVVAPFETVRGRGYRLDVRPAGAAPIQGGA